MEKIVYEEKIDELRDAGKTVELFCLLPSKYKDKEIVLRLKIKEKWAGWKIRSSVIKKLGLVDGETICASISPQLTAGLSEDVDEMTLFVSGYNNIKWIVDNEVTAGSIIDCRVKLSYIDLSSDSKKEPFYAANLIFIEGYKATKEEPQEDIDESGLSFDNLFSDLKSY